MISTTQATHSVSKSALVRRINRRLAPEGRQLRKYPNVRRWSSELGEYHVRHHSMIIERHVNIEELGRELGVLLDFEAVEEHD